MARPAKKNMNAKQVEELACFERNVHHNGIMDAAHCLVREYTFCAMKLSIAERLDDQEEIPAWATREHDLGVLMAYILGAMATNRHWEVAHAAAEHYEYTGEYPTW